MLSLQDSQWSSTHEDSTRVTHASRRNFASMEFQGQEVLSLQDNLRRSTHTSTQGDVIANSTPYARFPTDAPTRARISFFGSQVMRFCKRPISAYRDSYVNFYKEFYERSWYRKRTTYCISSGVPQEYLKRLYKQALLWLVVRSRNLRNPEEQVDHKKRDVEQSAPAHARHTHCTPMHLGTTADQSVTFLGTDFEKRAIWQGSVEKPAAKKFLARKVRTINWNEV